MAAYMTSGETRAVRPVPLCNNGVDNKLMGNTADVEFFDSDLLDGVDQVDMMIELFDGPSDSYAMSGQSLLFEYDHDSGIFSNITYGVDCAPGGIGPDEDRMPALIGAYSKVVHADFNQDGCTDLVLAGSSFFWHGTGVPSRLLFQRNSGGTCTGIFEDVTDEIVPPSSVPRMPTRYDNTLDVDVLDANGDEIPDIFFTVDLLHTQNGNLYPGQLLINSYRGNAGEFYDLSHEYFGDFEGSKLLLNTSSDVCDIDSDGDVDILQTVEMEPIDPSDNGNLFRNRLFINNGLGEFYDESESRGLPGYSAVDGSLFVGVSCKDIVAPDGSPNPDGYPEIFFVSSKRIGFYGDYPIKEMLINNGNGTFSEPKRYNTGHLPHSGEICDFDDNPDDTISNPVVLVANGVRVDLVWPLGGQGQEGVPEKNELLRFDSQSGGLVEAAREFGFVFDYPSLVTTDVECVDLDYNGVVDFVFVGNYGARNNLYVRRGGG